MYLSGRNSMCSSCIVFILWPCEMHLGLKDQLAAADVGLGVARRTYVCVRPEQDVLELRFLLVDVLDGLLGLVVGRSGLQDLRALGCGLALALQGKLILIYTQTLACPAGLVSAFCRCLFDQWIKARACSVPDVQPAKAALQTALELREIWCRKARRLPDTQDQRQYEMKLSTMTNCMHQDLKEPSDL